MSKILPTVTTEVDDDDINTWDVTLLDGLDDEPDDV